MRACEVIWSMISLFSYAEPSHVFAILILL